MPTALVVEDDAPLSNAIRCVLTLEDFTVLQAGTAGEAFAHIASEQVDVVILDVVLPDCNGYELCTQIRSTSSVSILMLTGLCDEASIVRGLQCGADDYVAKPFRPRELVARLRSILRRVGSVANSAPQVYEIGDVVFRPDHQSISCSGEIVGLSPTETELLATLLRHKGQVLEAQELAEKVWHCQIGSHEAHDLVKTAVSRLRAKIEPDRQHPRYVLTVRGRGYTLGV